MRFKRGTKVEVLCRRGIPLGSWRCGEIVCGNGHNYTVKYDGSDAVLERVSKKAIRPCPPASLNSECLNRGDVVEVFHGFSWKMATVMKVIKEGYVVVRPVGSITELEVSKEMIRSRTTWDGEKWATIGKIDGSNHSKRKRAEDELLHDTNETKPEQRSTGALASSSAANLQISTAKSITCSVGSCSISRDNVRMVGHLRLRSGNMDSLCSDAESYFKRGDDKKRQRLLNNDELAAEIHKLELYAYRCTIEALHASGPLSWDQEAMMTDLRLCLHISNDEHLMEIKNVVSAGRCIRSR